MNKEELEQKINLLLQKVAGYSTNSDINELVGMSSLADDIRSLYEAVIVLKHLNAETPEKEIEEEPAQEVTAQAEAVSEIQDTIDETPAIAIEEEHVAHTEETASEEEIEEVSKDKGEKEEDAQEERQETSESEAAPEPEPISESSITNETLQEPEQSINDQIESQSEANSVASQLERQPIDNLIHAIGINEKFLFTKELFNDDTQAYLNAIEKLNGFNTLDEAREYIDTELKPAYNWEDESEAASALSNLIEKRHSS